TLIYTLSLHDALPIYYKYSKKENKIIDLSYNYDYIQMHASSSFFRASSLQGVKFDTTLKYAEDAKFVYNVLKKTFKIGLMSYIQDRKSTRLNSSHVSI